MKGLPGDCQARQRTKKRLSGTSRRIHPTTFRAGMMVLNESLDKNIELALLSPAIQLHTSCPLDRILLISISSTANNSITVNHSFIGKNNSDTPFNLRPTTIDSNTINTLITGVTSTRITKANIISSNASLMLNSELTRLHLRVIRV
jgi:hypothetical protein